MPRILIVECMQEISSFNPLPSEYHDFQIQRGDEIYAQRGINSGVGGALSIYEAHNDVEVVPTYSEGQEAEGFFRASVGRGCPKNCSPRLRQWFPEPMPFISRCMAQWPRTANSIPRVIS
jgi:hypothetical protein